MDEKRAKELEEEIAKIATEYQKKKIAEMTKRKLEKAKAKKEGKKDV